LGLQEVFKEMIVIPVYEYEFAGRRLIVSD